MLYKIAPGYHSCLLFCMTILFRPQASPSLHDSDGEHTEQHRHQKAVAWSSWEKGDPIEQVQRLSEVG